MQLTVSPIYAAIITILILLLAARVSMLRNSEGVALGDGDKPRLRQAMAAHSHVLENALISLLLLLMLEINGLAVLYLHILGSTLVISRLLHMLGQSRHSGKSFGRFWGTLINWLLMLVMAILNVILLVGS